MRSFLLPLSLGAVLAIPVFAQEAPRIPWDDPAAVALGRTLYADHCASCHGTELEGEEDWQVRGPDGLLPAPPHDETGHTWHHPDAQLFDLTKYGVSAVLARRGQTYDSTMIGFGDVMSDDQILATLAYIKSRWPDQVIEMHNRFSEKQ